MRILLTLSILLNIVNIVAAAGYYDTYEYIDEPCSGEEIHWNVTPYNPYENTLIITNPYD